MKEKTAVEWLFEQLCSEKLSWNKDSNGKLFIDLTTMNILNDAKEIEKLENYKEYNRGWGDGYNNKAKEI